MNLQNELNVPNTSIAELIDKVLENPVDFYVAIADCMTPEERMYIMESLENKSCMNCVNGSCSVPHHEKTGLDEDGNFQGYKCTGWENHEYVGRSKILGRTDIYILK